MITTESLIGDELANDSLRAVQEFQSIAPKTLGELLSRLKEDRTKSLPMLKSTCSLLSSHFNLPVNEISIDLVAESRDEFRSFLVSRKYAANSIRSFVNYTRILLKNASDCGWKPNPSALEGWEDILALVVSRRCTAIAWHFARRHKSPNEVSATAMEDWVRTRVTLGRSLKSCERQKWALTRLIRDLGFTVIGQKQLSTQKKYGVPVSSLPTTLRDELVDLLKWKQAKYATDRPKDGRHRAISAKRLRIIVCGLFGFATKIHGETTITSFAQLIQKPIINAYAEWCINERSVSGKSLGSTLGTLYAAVRYRASRWSLDLSWFKPFLDTLPAEDESSKARKAEKYMDYRDVESIPARIRAQRISLPKDRSSTAALVVDELLLKWLATLPWRQRNLRECRITGPAPNLFKAKVAPFSEIDKPKWLLETEKTNPNIEVWQFHFGRDETKTGIEVSAVLPRILVPLLEEYLADYRSLLVKGVDPGTLFLNREGRSISITEMTDRVSSITLRYGGNRVNPHLLRDILAFAWLKAHPQDYLTLSKLLWHSNINTTIRIYGSRYNESSGVCAMEAWLEDRRAQQA